METYTVLKDTREKKGWEFKPYQKCVGMEMAPLKTGDYTIKEMPNLVCIERKFGVEELAINLGSDLDRFERELLRMEDFQYRYLIIECSMEDILKYPEGTRVPKNLVKITGKYIIRKLIELQMQYDFHFILCGNEGNGFIVAASILKRIFEKHKDDPRFERH